MPLKKALKEIEKKSDYRFLYNDDMLLEKRYARQFKYKRCIA
jgi:hypothetical protein